MSYKTTREKIEVMEAFERGETIQIQVQAKAGVIWEDLWYPESEPVWSWDSRDYRIKPKPREWWLHASPGSGAHCVHCSPAYAALCEEVKRWEVRPERIHVREVMEEV